jgi:signal transduction histidine kinase
MSKKSNTSKVTKKIAAEMGNDIKFIISFLPNLLLKGFNYVNDRLRFSISFKITTFYAFIFSFFLLLSNIAAVGGFLFFMEKHVTSFNTDQSIIYIEFIKGTVEVQDYLVILVLILLGSDILFLLMMLGMGSKMSKRMLFPVKKMTETVKQISIQDLNTRLDVRGSKDELKDLAKTFNDMLDRLQKSIETQNQFVSDASHELRTPIAVIQGYSNLLDRWGKEDKAVLEEAITAIKSESENMKNLVERLLFLARSDKNTQKIEMSEFNISELISEILRETKLIDEKHVIQSEVNEEVLIYGDRGLLKEAIRIFMDNSIKYTPDSGRIKLNSFIKNKYLVVDIEDTGIGISKEDLPHIFDRFYRADKSRTKETGGTGLGLSIAKWIILKHRGTIEVQSKIGYGTKVSILLPMNTR